jgi:hypothetical protein
MVLWKSKYCKNILTVTNIQNGCSKKDTMQINVLRLVTIDSVKANAPLYACGGTLNVTLTCHARGSNLKYQWYFGSFLIPSATAKTYTVHNSGVYRCKVSNTCSSNGKISSPLTLTTSPLIAINGSCVNKPMTLVSNATISISKWEERDTYDCGVGTFVTNPATGLSFTPTATGDYKSLVTIPNCGTFYSNIACAAICPTIISLTVKTDDEVLAEYYERLYPTTKPLEETHFDESGHPLSSEDVLGKYVEKANLRFSPNPTQGAINVEISLAISGKFKLFLTDLQGKKMVLAEENKTEGVYTFYFEEKINALPNGVYFLSLQTANEIVTKKMVKMQ